MLIDVSRKWVAGPFDVNSDNAQKILVYLLYLFHIKHYQHMENQPMFPEQSKELAESKAKLAMDNLKAWRKFSRTVFAEGALSEQTKELIAVAVAHVTQCPYCIRAHTKNAL